MPTLYDVLGISPPEVVDGFRQDPIDGVSMAYTFADAREPTRKQTQYFDNNGSRGIYRDGWFACTFGPLIPWDTAGSTASMKDWDPTRMSGNSTICDRLLPGGQPRGAGAGTAGGLEGGFPGGSQGQQGVPDRSGNLAAPASGRPCGHALYALAVRRHHHPDAEFTAPGLGRESNHVTSRLTSVKTLRACCMRSAAARGGLTLYMDQGRLVYEYNMMIIERTIARADEKLAPGRHRIEVDTTIARFGGPAEVVLTIDGREAARATVRRTVPAAFTASESFDVGVDLGSPVSLDYFDRRPFRFNGGIAGVTVEMK